MVDSLRGLLVWDAGARLPLYAFPREDIDMTRLEEGQPSNDAAARPAAQWYSLRSGTRFVPSAAWSYDDPELDGYVVFGRRSLDQWYEEDEEMLGHPRDPFSRVDALRSSRRVQVQVGGRLIADSSCPVLVFETGLRVRWYLPLSAVDADVLRESDHHTVCPYKGVASYFHVEVDDVLHENLFWVYREPLPEMAVIAGLLAPYDERVELVVDGARVVGEGVAG